MRKWYMVPLVILCAVALTACGGAPKSGDATGAPKAPKKVSLVLDWYPNAVHSFIYVAQKEGYFKAEGLDVEIKMPAENPSDGLKLVAAGKETFAIYYQTDTLVARSEGVPIVSVASIVRQPLNVLMMSEASGVNSPKDLAGKKIGYPSIPLDMGLVDTMVRHAGGDPSTIKYVEVGYDLIPAITSKNVDGIIGGYLNHEKLLLEKEGVKLKTFSPKDFGVPNFHELVLVAGEPVAADTELTAAFWRALSKGFAKVKADQAGALDTLLTSQAKEFPLDKAVETKSLALLVPMMDDNGSVQFGAQSVADWQKLAAWMTQEKILSKPVKAEEAVRVIVK
jgi:putative hydroxymethylpyrimidine transport system substrate-binding protein